MVDFKRKKGENFESFLRRFNKKLQQTGTLKLARKKRYLEQKDNKIKKKKRALTGQKIRNEKEYLKKIGKLKEDNRRRW